MIDGTAVSDRSLLDAITAGDSNASWELWQRHADELYALCLRAMNRNHADAEDALAQSMLKAVAQLPRFASRIVSVRSWLCRLTLNVCRDIVRERARLRMAEDSFPACDAAGDDAAEELLDVAEVWLARLPERLREVFVLRVESELSYTEIASRLQLTAAAARKRAQEARKLVMEWRAGAAVPPHTTTCAHRGAPAEAPSTLHKVRVQSTCGSEHEVDILVSRPHGREQQKIATLRKYIGRHPRGWKKCLQLADLLYVTGAWSEAIELYRAVLVKRPWLTAVAARIEAMARELENFTQGALAPSLQ